MTEYVVYRQPSLIDFLQVCSRLPEDEIEQYEVFSGTSFQPESVASMFFSRSGPQWVLTADGAPLAIAGFDQIRRGVWQDWLFSTPEAWSPEHWKAVTRRCRRAMDAMLQADAHRLQCVSLASRIQAHRWYRTLGLELEGTLHAYGVGGEDALIFSRVRAD